MTDRYDSPQDPSSRDRRVSSWWRALAILLLLLLFVGSATGISLFEQFKTQIRHLQGQLVEQPRIDRVAVLLDEQQRPALLATLDPKAGIVQLQRLNDIKEGREDGLQLWALNGDQPPRSLGVLARGIQTPQLPLDAARLNGATELAVSVQGKDGVEEAHGPNLPWLFRGWLVHKAL